MEIFNWIKDIEKIYENLISKARDTNLSEIEEFRNEQEIILGELLDLKKKRVNDTLLLLSDEINSNVKSFEDELGSSIKSIEKAYQENIENLKKSIIEKLGMNF